jgi:hypothetical protein
MESERISGGRLLERADRQRGTRRPHDSASRAAGVWVSPRGVRVSRG